MKKICTLLTSAVMLLSYGGGVLPQGAMQTVFAAEQEQGEAEAAGSVSLDEKTGILYLAGAVQAEDIRAYAGNEAVEIVTASKGCILPEDCTDLFKNFHASCIELTSADFSHVRNMSGMFAGSHVTELIVDNPDTSSVTDMDRMFKDCENLQELDQVLRYFDTSAVKSMDEMFANCSNLKELYLVSFDTANVKSMTDMFSQCSKLETIFCGGKWSIGQVAKSEGMFTGCNALTGGNGTAWSADCTDSQYACFDTNDTPGYITPKDPIDESPCGTTFVEETGTLILFGEVQRSNNLQDIKDLNPDAVKKVTCLKGTVLHECRGLFSGLSAAESIDLSNANTSNVTDMSMMFSGCKSLKELDVSGFDTTTVTNMQAMFSKCSNLTELDLSGFDTANVTDMNMMFEGCTELTYLDLSGFDTANVTNMEIMFGNCSALSALGLSGFNTSNVKRMNAMFAFCQSLTELDLSSFDTSNVEDMSDMFELCSNLTAIYCSDKWNMDKVQESGRMFDDCTSLSGRNFTKWNREHIDGEYARIDADDTPGYFCAAEDTDDSFYSTIFIEKTGTLILQHKIPESIDYCRGVWEKWKPEQVKKIICFKGAVLPDHCKLFTACPEAESIDLSNADTSKVKDMSEMFSGCESLKKLNLSGIDTSNVTNMNYMLDGCESLTALDLSGFDTANVTEMGCMFRKCKALTELDLSGFDTASVTEMGAMFAECQSLTKLDLSGFNTANVTNMHAMFAECEALKALDLSGFDTANVTDMSWMFSNCYKLTELDLSGFNTENVTSMHQMFADCEALEKLDLSGFDTSNVTDMFAMFAKCYSLTELDLSGFNTPNVKNMRDMFMDCQALEKLDLSGFYTANVTDMSWMFSGCSTLTELDLSSFNTSKVTNISNMFNNCLSLIKLDLSGFNIEKVTDMNYMFSGCKSLTELDLSGFKKTDVCGMYGMFGNAEKLKTIYVSDAWQILQACDTSFMFVNCEALIGGNGTAYNDQHVDGTYARIDTEDAPGYFTLKKAQAPETDWGNADCKGGVDVSDAVIMARFSAEDSTVKITAQGKRNADVTHDGNINSDDVMLVLKYIAKLIPYSDLEPASDSEA